MKQPQANALYGYRYGEVPLPDPLASVPHVIHSLKTGNRKIALTNLGVRVQAAALPTPDRSDGLTAAMGARKRLLVQPPVANRLLRRQLRSFSRKWLRENLQPISVDSDTSFEAWINDVGYPLWRKDELRKTWTKMGGQFNPKHLQVKSFGKDESYPDFKHFRLINSRSDEWKCLVGPIFRLIDKELFSNPYFIKKIPVAERGQYVMDNVHTDGCRYMSTDYTSYEGQFVREAFKATTIELIKWMLSRLDDWFLNLVTNGLLGTNRLYNRYYCIEVIAKLMSGEMCTSSSNGFSNLMAALFVLHRRGSILRGVVEGDDGLFAFEGEPPTAAEFAAIGFDIKIETHDRVSTASFCGLIFDEEDCIVITDPWPEVVQVGWASGKYHGYSARKKKSLLRSRAMSMAAQYGRCPVLGVLAEYLLKYTGGCDPRSFIENDRNLSWWDREIMREASRLGRFEYIKPPLRTYQLMAEQFGVSVDMLYLIEDRLKGGDLDVLNRLGLVLVPWTQYYACYAVPTDDKPYRQFPGAAADLLLHTYV